MLKLSLAKEFGLSHFQLLTLMLVGGTEQIQIKQLKQKLSIPGSSLTFTIDSLEKKKLVKRQMSKEDKRQWLLSLTPKGQRLYQDVIAAEEENILSALNKLTDEEKTAFLKIAGEIIAPDKTDRLEKYQIFGKEE
jgi:MarR family 2-MHQ and catechol resistance regulon transcriptional repressor